MRSSGLDERVPRDRPAQDAYEIRNEKSHFIAKIAVSGMLLAQGLPAWQETVGARPVLSAAVPPTGTEKLAVQWMKASAPGQGVMLFAVARPGGAGPFPAVLLLHGTHGFAQQYVKLAEDLARGGLLAVAACWCSGGSGGFAVHNTN